MCALTVLYARVSEVRNLISWEICE